MNVSRNHVGRFTHAGGMVILVQVHGLARQSNAGLFLSRTFLVVHPMHLHQYTRAARAHKSANMDSANMIFSH